MPGKSKPYIKWDKLRLIYRIKALEAYVHSLEKAFRPRPTTEPALVYMDKEKEELIRQLLLRDRLLEEMSKLLGELKEENQSLHDQLEEAQKAEEVLRKPKKDSKTSSQPPSQDEKAKVTKPSGWGAKPRHQGFSYQPLPHDKVRVSSSTWYSLIHTFRKQGINVFEALKAIFDGITPKINFPQLE